MVGLLLAVAVFGVFRSAVPAADPSGGASLAHPTGVTSVPSPPVLASPSVAPDSVAAEAPPQPRPREAARELRPSPVPGRTALPGGTEGSQAREVAATTAVAPPPEEARPADPEISPSPPSASVALPAAGKGWLQLLVIPWAEVSVDDRRVGTTPMRALELPAGTHSVRLSHPDYGLLLREVSIQHGETTRLEVDLSDSTRP
jgi:hypothetical protein